MNGKPVPNVPVVCNLGLTISSDLSWSEHVQSLVRKVGWKVNLLKRLAFRARLSIPVFSLLYKCLVRSCLEYASPVWNGCSTADSHSLERFQLSLARATFGSSFASNLSKSQVLSHLGWPTLSWRRRRQQLVYFWQLKNGFGPPSLSVRLPAAVTERCPYNLRSSHSSQVPFCSSSSRLSSFMPSSCILWNTLPASVISAKSTASFSRQLDCFFSCDMFSFGIPP